MLAVNGDAESGIHRLVWYYGLHRQQQEIILSAHYEQRGPAEQVEAHPLAFSRTGTLALHVPVSLNRHAPLLAFRLPRLVEDPQGIEYAGRRKLRAVDGHVRTIESVWGAHEVATLVMAMQRGRDVHV